jgi:hypothetical protein
MESRINTINILPARFLNKQEDGKYLIRVLFNNDTIEDRIFDNYSLTGMTNPDYLFISIITGLNSIRIDFFDMNDFKRIFHRKWKTLIK